MEIEDEGTNLEVFSLALQNGSLKEKDLLGRQTAVTIEGTDQHFYHGYLLWYNLTSLHIVTCFQFPMAAK